MGKAHPITPTAPTSSLNVDSVGAAASKLAAASYPFAKSVDWNSDLFVKPVPGASPKDVLGAVDKMIVMGASMDGKLLKEAAEAHHKAIGSVVAKALGNGVVANNMFAFSTKGDAIGAYKAFLEF